jgi:hypothetical protein
VANITNMFSNCLTRIEKEVPAIIHNLCFSLDDMKLSKEIPLF